MPKLNNDYLIEIFEKSQESESKEKSLEKFMLARKECVEAGINFFRKLEVTKVAITGNRWQFFENNPNYKPNVFYSLRGGHERHNLLYDFDNYVFIQAISQGLNFDKIDFIELTSPNQNCFGFLKKFEKLIDLSIECEKVKECKVILSVLLNLKLVDSLTLKVSGIDSRFIDSLNFQYTILNLYKFKFEKKLNFVKPKQNVKSVVLIGDEEAKKAFVFEPKHFINYYKVFPKAEFNFEIHHTVTDKDVDCLHFFDDNYFPTISKATKEYAKICVNYYNNESILISTLWKEIRLHTKAMCITCPIDTPVAKEIDRKVQFFIRYEFPKRLEYISSRWNPRIQFTQTIPNKYNKKFKPKDFIKLQIMDANRNCAIVKCLKDMKFGYIYNLYGNRIGINFHQLRLLTSGRRVAHDDTPRQFQMKDFDKIYVFPEQYG